MPTNKIKPYERLLCILAFYAKNPGLKSFCKSEDKRIKRLEQLGFLTVFWNSRQAEFTGKMFIK